MIHIFEDYYIIGDEKCYELAKKTTSVNKSTGKIKYSPIGYYTTIEELVKGFIKYMVRRYISNEKEQTLNELKTYQENLYKTIEKNIGL